MSAAQKGMKISLSVAGAKSGVSIPQRARDLIERVCAEHGVSVADVLGERRFAKLVVVRRACWRELRDLRRPDGEQFSFPQIGAWFGRDHSTVLQGLSKLSAGGRPA